MVRAGLTEFGSMIFRVAVILIAVVFGWTYVTRTGDRDRMDERRALDHRAAELVGRAIAPGSAIACLEATNTETVEGSCERAVFASPETVAAATAYMAARLSLLADAHEFTSRRDQSYESQIAGLRRTVAADRYGLSSQVLATRDGCTADACDAFGLVYDDKKLRANMKDRLFDITVARYAANWPTRTRPLASGGPSAACRARTSRSRRRSRCRRSSGAEPPRRRPAPSGRAPHRTPRRAADQFGAGFRHQAAAAAGGPEGGREERDAADVAQSGGQAISRARIATRCLSRRLALRLAHVHLGPDRQSRRDRRPHRAHRASASACA